MPNWCSNNLSMSGPPDQVRAILDAVRHSDGVEDEKMRLTKFMPQPVDEAGELIDGVSWQYDTWGTKWGDCDTDISSPLGFSDGSWEALIHYQTAWGPADAGFLKVSAMFPTVFFIFDYEEEAGFFAGTQVMQDGATVFESMYEPSSYEGEIDWDDEESMHKYEAWKEEKTDAIFAEYAEFRKGISV